MRWSFCLSNCQYFPLPSLTLALHQSFAGPRTLVMFLVADSQPAEMEVLKHPWATSEVSRQSHLEEQRNWGAWDVSPMTPWILEKRLAKLLFSFNVLYPFLSACQGIVSFPEKVRNSRRWTKSKWLMIILVNWLETAVGSRNKAGWWGGRCGGFWLRQAVI